MSVTWHAYVPLQTSVLFQMCDASILAFLKLTTGVVGGKAKLRCEGLSEIPSTIFLPIWESLSFSVDIPVFWGDPWCAVSGTFCHGGGCAEDRSPACKWGSLFLVTGAMSYKAIHRHFVGHCLWVPKSPAWETMSSYVPPCHPCRHSAPSSVKYLPGEAELISPPALTLQCQCWEEAAGHVCKNNAY